MQELKYILSALVIVVVILVSSLQYNANENRKAYHACLQLSEKLAQQQKQPDGGVRIVSLPYCRN
jgi:uncharacterized protein involved in exopolysaccharide biosynthesis